MQVRLKMAWGQWSKGHVFTDMPGGQARTLIERNIAEAYEPKVLASPVDRMMRPENKQGKKAQLLLDRATR